jgi:hypothetical protein
MRVLVAPRNERDDARGQIGLVGEVGEPQALALQDAEPLLDLVQLRAASAA